MGEESDVDLGTPDSVWREDGRDCARCGETVKRLWKQDDELVCEACKRW